MPRAQIVAATLIAVAGFAVAPLPLHGADDDAIAEGRELYMDYQCWQCHGYEGQGGAAPRVASMNYPYAAFERFVRFPNVMPAYPPGQLDDDALRRIYDFVQSLPDAPRREDIPALDID